MALTLSRRELGLIYTLLRNTNNVLETSSHDSTSTQSTDGAFPKTARLSKLIAANLRQKLQNELAEKG